jgi:hypothetical protein
MKLDLEPIMTGWIAMNVLALVSFLCAEIGARRRRRAGAAEPAEAEAPAADPVPEDVAETLAALIREVEQEEGAMLPRAAGSCRSGGRGAADARVA